MFGKEQTLLPCSSVFCPSVQSEDDEVIAWSETKHPPEIKLSSPLVSLTHPKREHSCSFRVLVLLCQPELRTRSQLYSMVTSTHSF